MNTGRNIGQGIVSFLLKGRKYRCNLCGSTFRILQRDKYQQRENARCPRCQSDESMRTLWFYLTNEILGRKNKNRFLFVGNESILTRKLKESPLVFEYCDPAYFHAPGSDDFDRLPGNVFDVVILHQVLQYIPDDQLVFSELRRILRPGGIALIQTLIHPDMDRTYENISNPDDIDRLKAHYEPGVLRIYGTNFSKHLARSGFEIETVDYAEQLGTAARNYYRLGMGPREMIYKCKKNINQSTWKS
ncbi:MAG TPA: methyltransferase domain-containing protein [Prolixibacteraceae bacterium]|nr:methyltransferase domain-containing protein [Prolixibacteraceae bacterium]